MNISDRTKFGGVKNGMLYGEKAKIINIRLTISVTDINVEFDRTILVLV